ncbi:MAG: CheW domain-containing protein [Ignavibacteria bacterium]|jgi:chemotaxis signal transduction protein|nr:CheW domain-containing protein [Ignavibacteria bacterium]
MEPNVATHNNSNHSDSDAASKNKELREKFIVLEIENESFIIPLEYVSEIVRVQEITEAPHQPEWVRGIMNLRDSVISLIDTRKRLGVKSYVGQALATVSKSKEALIKWVDTLEYAVRNQTSVDTKADPHLVDFIDWANGLIGQKETPPQIEKKLTEMKSINNDFHEKGKKVIELSAAGKHEAATELFETIKDEFVTRILTQFEGLEEEFRNVHSKNIAVILEFEGVHFAMLADDITKMKNFTQEGRQKGSLTDSPFVLGVFDDEEGLYQELDLKGILKGHREEIAEVAADKK